jgi:hypothetical protein
MWTVDTDLVHVLDDFIRHIQMPCIFHVHKAAKTTPYRYQCSYRWYLMVSSLDRFF